MSWSTGLAALMPDTVVIQGLSSFSTDGYLTPVYGPASTHRARVVRKNTLVRTFAGTEELATTVAWVLTTSTFDPSSRVRVNGSTLGPLMAAETYPDEVGRDHLKLFWG